MQDHPSDPTPSPIKLWTARAGPTLLAAVVLVGLGYGAAQFKARQPAVAEAREISVLAPPVAAPAPPEQPAPATQPALAAKPAATQPIVQADVSMSPDQLFAAASDSVFVVEVASADGKRTMLGTGFLVSADGLVLTNYHVIRNGSTGIIKTPDGNKQYSVTGVAAADRYGDLALLETEARGKPLAIAADAPPAIGTRVYAIGNPEGFTNTLSEGLISGIRADAKFLPMLQITVPISHGSSGGPLLTAEGQVVGVTTLSMSDAQNLNFAVPAARIHRILSNRGPAVPLAVAGAATALENRIALDNIWCALLAGQFMTGSFLLNDLDDRQQNNSRYWFLEGYLQEHTRRFQTAIADYRKSLSLSPQYPATIYLRLGCTLTAERNYAQAIDAYRGCLKLEPNNIIAWQSAALTFELMGQTTKAIGVVRKSIHLDPDNPQWYSILGGCYLSLHQSAGAIDAYQNYTRIKPADPMGWLLLGSSHYLAKDEPAARLALDKAVQLDPDGAFGITARDALRRMDAQQSLAGTDPTR